MPQLRNVKPRQVIKFLKKWGFYFAHSKGSHHVYVNKETNYAVVISVHGGKTIPPGTMGSIIRQSGIPKKEWLKLK